MMHSPFRASSVLAGVTLMVTLWMPISGVFASTESDLAREKARQILQDKKYGDQENAPLSDQAQRLSRWLGAKDKDGTIEKRTNKEIKEESRPVERQTITPPAVGGLGIVGTIILWIFVALLIGGLGFLIFKYIRNSNGKKKDLEENEEIDIDWSEEEKVLELVTDADLLERLSDEAEKSGKFELALRYRFRAGLLRLNDMKVIAFHPSVTNAQWQLIVDNDSFNLLTRDFNDVTYGERTCDASHLSRARRNWSSLVSKKESREQKL